ncbi:MAG: DUF4252 domain-containing protein [Pseudomonadota bacterium]
MRPLTRLVVLIAVLALTGCGISGNLRHHAGYAPFDSPKSWEADDVMAVSLGPLPLRIARVFVDEDEEGMEVLRALDAVRVYIYELDGDNQRINARLDATAKDLEAAGWSPMVAVREDDGFVRVLVAMESGDQIDGMVVMVSEPDEVVLVNLMGDIRPELFSDYMAGMDVDVPPVTIDESG